MTTSKPVRRADADPTVRQALSRSLRAVRNQYTEQVYAWERFFRMGLPQTREQAAAMARGDQASRADSRVPAGAGRSGRAA